MAAGASRLAERTGVRRIRPAGARGHAERHLFRSAYALMLNTVLTGGSGFLFWLLAARLYTPAEVGVDAALIALMASVSAICQLNLGNVYPRFLADATRPGRVIALGYAAAGLLSLLAGAVAIVVVPRFSGNLAVLGGHPALSVMWLVSVVLWSVFALQDSALTGLRYAQWVPLENGIYGVLKLAGLVLLAVVGVANGIFIAWVIPMAALLIPVNVVVFRRAVPAHRPTTRTVTVEPFGRTRLIRFLGLNYLSSVFDQGLFAALPLLIVALLGATQAAYYFIPFTIVTTLDMLAYNMTTSLTVESAFATDRMHGLAVAASRRFLVILLPVTLGLIVFAPVVLLPFGRAYADHGTTILRILALASMFRAVVTLNEAVCRVTGRGAILATVSAFRCAVVLGYTVVLAQAWGLTGVGVAWLVAWGAVAALVTPMLWRFFRAGGAEGAIARAAGSREYAEPAIAATLSPPPLRPVGTGTAVGRDAPSHGPETGGPR